MEEKRTQKQKVLKIMISKKNPEKWFYPYEFIQDEGIFIGYKAPTRFCELCLDFPEMIESKMEGKYRIGRFRFENSINFLPKLPPELKNFVQNELLESGAGYEEYRTEAVITENKTVHFIKIKKKING